MNAFNMVNMAAACVLTSTEHAKQLGIPENKWIYVRGGTGTEESKNCEFACFDGRNMETLIFDDVLQSGNDRITIQVPPFLAALTKDFAFQGLGSMRLTYLTSIREWLKGLMHVA